MSPLADSGRSSSRLGVNRTGEPLWLHLTLGLGKNRAPGAVREICRLFAARLGSRKAMPAQKAR